VSWPFISWWLAAKEQQSSTYDAMNVERCTVIIAARNEADRIAKTLEGIKSLRSLDVFVVVVSDGSTDDTVARARDSGVDAVVDLPSSVGKTAAMRRGMEMRRRGDYVVFMDATTHVDESSLMALLQSFSDPAIGAASGLVIYEYSEHAVSEGFRAYQQAVVWSRMTDSHWFTVSSVSGALCAIRPEIWSDTVPDDVTPDLAIPFWAARVGLRTRLVSDAMCFDTSRRSAGSVFRARLRMALQAYSFMTYVWTSRQGIPRRYWCVLLGHKVARWLSPVALAMMLLAMIFVWPVSALALLLTVSSPVFLAQLPGGARLFGPSYFFVTVSAAYVVGLMYFLAGKRAAVWEPNAQRR